ncbi:MAG: calcium-binding protein [bacterium]
MKLTHKSAGLGIAALAVLMLGSAAVADKMGNMPMNGGMGGPEMGMGMMPGPQLSIAAIDTDKDGKISKDEMTAYRASQTAGVDANGDGKLSVDEIAAMHLKAMTAAATAMAQRMVDRMDTDGDHMLSAAELLARPMPGNMFDRLDTNKDGFVDQAELDAGMQAMMNHRGPGRDGGRYGGHDGGRGGHFMSNSNGNAAPAPDSNGSGGN